MYICICCIVKHLYLLCYVSDYSTYAFDESTERLTVIKNDGTTRPARCKTYCLANRAQENWYIKLSDTAARAYA